ncbi:group II intron reverse transcriptase/maturase [Desulfosarcina ovata]|uniref:Group II intron reverse transcriptase/maturase n=1 Tax=Desulfosarcina ovata subsp. ovata TaxID=2752305 RepID=A0A5K8A3D0_9BACT|nr:group II intron reverse transcriptase/maturase [Desulfosarcina ovata]BBO87022.1 group II intron reverse transcriptase/maturase [Desulfosarcina ovata subsp. ovata]BBO87037.1 group II intron reverse transcriptase/maturase [Desulfosarcina ovata subsp. ovata]BBO88063.1 group II intron reverse transcriptase/maturase [Desulfosarcina ovata subsp. ovata]BBO90013.1 group II intron reverse transcriptase/maturase [Desulfosarcina ovata subsp. ovata]BBO90014.1 group II intron reverse transcriptase/matur
MNIKPQQMEMFVASRLAESLGGREQLLELILERRNVLRAMNQVVANKGAPGVDGMKTNHLKGYLKRHWPKIKQDLLNGDYRPLPVRRKEIDKPDGGVRLLGIPTVLDRLIQQTIAQVLEQIWDPTFSEYSYGFRPGRSAHDAVLQAKGYLLDGYTHVVDMDLSKFFDRVNHDRLLSRLATRVRDKRVLKLIRRYLTAGTMIGGLVSPSIEGTPQGGPLSPLLSNIVLDELDKELEKRGHQFVRYADDFRIYCKSRKAAERVNKSITKFITAKLKLKVNEEKSAVSRPWLRKFLGFTFISMCGQTKIRIHRKTISRFKERVRELTNRNQGRSLSQIIKDLNQYLIGWWNYYRLTEARHLFKSLNGWIIRRLRCVVWKQWKNPRTKVRNLKKLGIAHKDAMLCGNARKKYWRMSKVKWVIFALPNRYFFERGLFLPAQ